MYIHDLHFFYIFVAVITGGPNHIEDDLEVASSDVNTGEEVDADDAEDDDGGDEDAEEDDEEDEEAEIEIGDEDTDEDDGKNFCERISAFVMPFLSTVV